MGEKNINLMTEEDFKQYLQNNLNIHYFECIGRFRSVLRAFRRGHITNFGYVVPKRPFNNKAHTKGRKLNIDKKRIYENLTNKTVIC